MLLDKEDKLPNENILYETRPSLIFGCKRVILAFILVIILLIYWPKVSKYVGGMQAKFTSISLGSYVSILGIAIMFVLLLYIMYKLIKWYYTEYTLTDSRIIVQKGLLFTQKNYMPYTTIQDIDSSQSIIGRIFGVASISVYSAYDSNNMQLKNISNAKKIEEIIFNQMNYYRFNFHHQEPMYQNPQGYPNSQRGYNEPSYHDSQGYPNSQRGYNEHNYQEYIHEEPEYLNSKLYYNPYETIEVEHNDHYEDYYTDEYGDPEGVITPEHNFHKQGFDDRAYVTIENIESNDRFNQNNYRPNKPYHEEVGDYFIERDKNQKNNPNNRKANDESLSKEKIIENHFDKFKS